MPDVVLSAMGVLREVSGVDDTFDEILRAIRVEEFGANSGDGGDIVGCDGGAEEE